mmetsp:Transcript_103607/g.332057  ORF Transcript_103607/g.332057 Transcript_103607/m.332057 type:complete len:244 (-) Transcript_103607:250-981(-)
MSILLDPGCPAEFLQSSAERGEVYGPTETVGARGGGVAGDVLEAWPRGHRHQRAGALGRELLQALHAGLGAVVATHTHTLRSRGPREGLGGGGGGGAGTGCSASCGLGGHRGAAAPSGSSAGGGPGYVLRQRRRRRCCCSRPLRRFRCCPATLEGACLQAGAREFLQPLRAAELEECHFHRGLRLRAGCGAGRHLGEADEVASLPHENSEDARRAHDRRADPAGQSASRWHILDREVRREFGH